MTTVIAYATDGKVFMAADSQTSVYERPMMVAKKIRRLSVDGEEILLGICGDGAMAHLIQNTLKPAPTPADDVELQDWADMLAVDICEMAKRYELHERHDGTILLGVRGRLFALAHMQAIEAEDGLCGVGSGGDVALGALDALVDHPEFDVDAADAAAIVVRACYIGVSRDTYSGGPIQIEMLDGHA